MHSTCPILEITAIFSAIFLPTPGAVAIVFASPVAIAEIKVSDFIVPIIANATFPLFTSGLKKFDEAVKEGTLTAVLGTNLTYRKPELLERDWYFDVDCSKYTAYFIAAINHDMSVSSICDPIVKIKNLLAERASRGMDTSWQTPKDVYNWWMEYDIMPGQMDIFDFIEDEDE